VTSSWFFLSTLNYDTRSTTHQKYFKELLNPETERINSIKTHEGPINNSELKEPTYEEINEIITNMKPNKAAGPDEILPEFITNRGLTLKQNTSVNNEDTETTKDIW